MLKVFCSLLTTLGLLVGCAAQPAPAPTAAPTTAPTTAPTIQPTNVPTAAPNALKDGDFVAETSQTYTDNVGHGWREYVKLTVSDGQIIQMEYDALKDGKKKSETTPEEYPMEPHPSQWTAQLTANMEAADNPAEIDAVAGATQSSQMIKKLYAAALEAARRGDETAAVVE